MNDQISDVTPFDEAVKERAYSQPNVNATQERIYTPIPEANFVAPPLDLNQETPFDKKEEPPKAKYSANSRKPEPPPPVNPELKDLPPADKRASAEFMAKVVMDGYEMANNLANKLIVVNTDNLVSMQAEGEIDLGIQIPYDMAGNVITAGEFIEQYNDQAKDTFKVDPEFRQDVEPVMARVFEKRGIGVTDEQYLIIAFGKDIAMKAITGFSMKKTINTFIGAIKEQTAAIRSGQATPPPPPQPKERRQEQQQHEQEQNTSVRMPYDTSGYSEPEEIIIEESINTDDSEIRHQQAPRTRVGAKRGKYKPREKKKAA